MAGISKSDICKAYLDKKKYANMPTATLAKKIYSDNIEVFTTAESVRHLLRYYRGSLGKEKKAQLIRNNDDKYMKNNPGNLAPYPNLPKAKVHFQNWGHYELEAEKVLNLSDIHCPFQDNEALESALAYGEEQGVDCIIFNGDLADFYSVSFHEKNPKLRNFAAEINSCIQILEHVRGRFPDAKIIYKLGNHELRLVRYLMVKAPELLDLEFFSFRNVFQLDRLNIELIEDMRLIKYQNYVICHGHEFFGGGGAYPAKAYFMKAKTNIISAHLHRTSSYSEQDVFREVKRAYSSGCLCEMHPDYAQINFWNHGAVILTKTGDNKARVDNFVIEDGVVV